MSDGERVKSASKFLGLFFPSLLRLPHCIRPLLSYTHYVRVFSCPKEIQRGIFCVALRCSDFGLTHLILQSGNGNTIYALSYSTLSQFHFGHSSEFSTALLITLLLLQ